MNFLNLLKILDTKDININTCLNCFNT